MYRNVREERYTKKRFQHPSSQKKIERGGREGERSEKDVAKNA